MFGRKPISSVVHQHARFPDAIFPDDDAFDDVTLQHHHICIFCTLDSSNNTPPTIQLNSFRFPHLTMSLYKFAEFPTSFSNLFFLVTESLKKYLKNPEKKILFGTLPLSHLNARALAECIFHM